MGTAFYSEHFPIRVWDRSISMAEIVIRVSDKAQRVAGLFLVGSFLFSVFLVLWYSDAFSPKYRLQVYAPDVSGFTATTQVKLDGVPVGSVSAIKVAGESSSPERRIEIDLRIDKRFQQAIRSDSTATLMMEALLGDPYLNIQRGFKGSIIAPGGEIQFMPMRGVKVENFPALLEKLANCGQTAKAPSESKEHAMPDTPARTKQ